LDKRASATEGESLSKIPMRYGFPRAPYNLDAAFVWSGNGRMYFIKGIQPVMRSVCCSALLYFVVYRLPAVSYDWLAYGT